ncbi:21489_t:CDS:2, partial [Racocetra persica]
IINIENMLKRFDSKNPMVALNKDIEEIENNRVKGKKVKVKNNIDEEIMNQVGNDYANDKEKTKIGKTIKNNEKSLKKKKEHKKDKHLLEI